MRRKAIVFEHLEGWHTPFLWWYLWRNYAVYYLNPPSIGSAQGTLYKLAASRRIQHLTLAEPLELQDDPAYDMAFEATDTLYDRTVRGRSSVVQRMLGLYQSEDVHLAFKKQLLFELADYFHCQMRLNQIQKRLHDVEKLAFVPINATDAVLASKYDAFLRDSNGMEPIGATEVRFPWWSRVMGTLGMARKKIKAIKVCAYTMTMASYQCLRSLGKTSPQQTYDFAIAVVSPSRQFANDIQGVDFLLDGQQVRKENTIFVPVVRLSKHYVQPMENRGLFVAKRAVLTSGKTCKAVLVNAGFILSTILLTPEWVGRVGSYLVRDYWSWSGFLQRYRVGQFVTYADVGFRQISRNILLKHQGVQTWYYLDTENLSLNLNHVGNARRHKYWGYLYYDNLVAWTPRVVEYHQSHKQTIGRYFAVGCLWSEHVRLLREGKIPCRLRQRLKDVGYREDQKLIAVFDSTYANLSRTTYSDGIGFAQGIEQLLEDLPGIFVAWKEKKPYWVHREEGSSDLIALYDRMATHPRCYFAGYETSPSEVSALSDLTISFPFTSTTREALGAGMKAIYYIPNDKLAGSYFERFPDIVAHNRSELRSIVERLLFHTTDEEYNNYIETYLKGEIEPYLDGRALTRLRDLLCAGSEKSLVPAAEPAIS